MAVQMIADLFAVNVDGMTPLAIAVSNPRGECYFTSPDDLPFVNSPLLDFSISQSPR